MSGILYLSLEYLKTPIFYDHLYLFGDYPFMGTNYALKSLNLNSIDHFIYLFISLLNLLAILLDLLYSHYLNNSHVSNIPYLSYFFYIPNYQYLSLTIHYCHPKLPYYLIPVDYFQHSLMKYVIFLQIFLNSNLSYLTFNEMLKNQHHLPSLIFSYSIHQNYYLINYSF